MRLIVNPVRVINGHMGIALSRLDISVAQNLPDVSPMPERFCGSCMAQHVACPFLLMTDRMMLYPVRSKYWLLTSANAMVPL